MSLSQLHAGTELTLCTAAGVPVGNLIVTSASSSGDVVASFRLIESAEAAEELSLIHELIGATNDFAFAAMEQIELELAAKGLCLCDGNGRYVLRREFAGVVITNEVTQIAFCVK